MESMQGYRFLVDGQVPRGLARVASLATTRLPFKEVLASVDMVVTKPGYGTIVEAVALRKPVLYVRRHNFADEQSLVDYLHRYGRGAELSPTDFLAGDWEPTMHTLVNQSVCQAPPPLTGATDAAQALSPYFRQ
jgi:UDP-N-acetylglucosamine:LPS N-acetylglucosamine transferase